MALIEKEIPEGRSQAEMTLVKMLKKHRCWADVKTITQALSMIGSIADNLERESKAFMQGNTNKEDGIGTKQLK